MDDMERIEKLNREYWGRVAAGLSQKQAAELVYASARAWQNWESESGSNRAMHPAIFELFLVKTNRINETPDKPK